MNTMTTTTPAHGLTIDRDIADGAPVYERYPRQTTAQPAFIWLTEDGEVTARADGNINSIPMSVYNLVDLRWRIPSATSGAKLRELLADDSELVRLLAIVHAGHSVDRDSGDAHGDLTTAARDADERITSLLERLDGDAESLTPVWAVGDWLFNDCTLADHWPTGRTLDQAVEEIESVAAAEGLVLDGDVREALLDAALSEAREAIDKEVRPALCALHLDALAADGKLDGDELATLRNLTWGV